MHRDDPMCRARAPLRGPPHNLQSMSRSWRASWGCDWQLPTLGSARLTRCILGSLSRVRCCDGGWGFERGSGVAVLCLTSCEASWSPLRVSSKLRYHILNTHERSQTVRKKDQHFSEYMFFMFWLEFWRKLEKSASFIPAFLGRPWHFKLKFLN